MVEEQGIYVHAGDGRNRLVYGGHTLDTTPMGLRNSFGLYVNGKRLSIDGVGVAESATAGRLIPNDDGVTFNEVDMLPSIGKCINITQEDYNTLYSGGLVEGYKRFSNTEIYNIVGNVGTAPEVTYTVNNGVVTFSSGATMGTGSELIYGNAEGVLTENTLDASETLSNTNPPVVLVRWFEPVIPIGGTIEIGYHVDDQMMSAIHYDSLGKTFTVIVKTASGTVAKKTTYAGEFKMETPAFLTAGETWFTVEVVDSNGVGSAVQYFDILVRDAVTPNHYVMQEADLETYGIVMGEATQLEAYTNKAALTDFFADVKRNGYNGVKMLDGIYYIDYHKNVGNEDGVVDFGSQTFYRIDIDNGVITNVSPATYEEIYNDCKFTDSAGNIPEVGNGYVVDSSGGAYRYLVINTARAGEQIVFPDEFTVDLNGATLRAYPCDDLSGAGNGALINLADNFDTHIVNGKIYGNYENFDFEAAKIKLGKGRTSKPQNFVPSEWLGVTQMSNKSRYCSFENVEIAYSVGYEGTVNGIRGGVIDNVTYYKDLTADGTGKAIDTSTGELVDVEGMVTSKKVTLQFKDEIFAGVSGGYGGYGSTTRREVFFSFYDENDNYLGTIKSHLYFLVKVPSGAEKVRITFYGALMQLVYAVIPKNVGYRNCYWHDTRTIASHPCEVRGFYLSGCRFNNIACETTYGITSVLGDIEDGADMTHRIIIKDCVCEDGLDYTRRIFIVDVCYGLEWYGNEGISIEYGHSYQTGICSGWVENSQMPRVGLYRNARIPRPFVVWKGNVIDTISYLNFNGGVGNWPVAVVPYVVMEDTTIITAFFSEHLKLKNSTNGSQREYTYGEPDSMSI